MTAFISWYIVITILGWLTFPLAYHLFPGLADRGYTLARALGLLVWSFGHDVGWLWRRRPRVTGDVSPYPAANVRPGGGLAVLRWNGRNQH